MLVAVWLALAPADASTAFSAAEWLADSCSEPASSASLGSDSCRFVARLCVGGQQCGAYLQAREG
jgi:hypothetical protein